MSQPPLNALRAFEAVARTGSFQAAAEDLHVTQSAVSHQIKHLEQWLGAPLFDRGGRSPKLLPRAVALARDLTMAFDGIDAACRRARPASSEGTLVVAAIPSVAICWLIPRLPDFTATHPDIDLRILATDRLSSFQTDAVDIAVRYGRPPFGAGLNTELLFEQVIVAVASPLLLEKLGPPDEDDNLTRYALLHDAHNFWPQFLERAYPGGVTASAKNIRFNQTSLAVDAAVAGQGLALASLFFVQDDIDAGRLARPFATELRVGSDFYLVSPRKPRHPEPTADVRSWLLTAAR